MNKSFAVACLLGLTTAQNESAELQQATWEEDNHPTAAVAYYEQYFEDAGDAVGEAEATEIEETDSESETESNDIKKINKIEMVEQVVFGLLEGIFDAEDMGNVTKCIQDSEELLVLVPKTAKDFRKNNIGGAIDGVKDIVEILKVVHDAFKDCGTIGADIVAISQMITAMSSPHAFAFHVGQDLLVNGVSIFKEINQAIDDYKNKEWKSFGYNIGEASAQILIGKMTVVTMAKRSRGMPEFLLDQEDEEEAEDLEYALIMDEKKETPAITGFTKDSLKDYMVSGFENDEFQKCKEGLEYAMENFKNGMSHLEEAIANRDMALLEVSLFILLGVLQTIVQTMPDCKNIFKAEVSEKLNLTTLTKIQNSIEGGNIAISDDGELSMNGQVITDEVMKMIQDFKAENFNNIETDLMTIMYPTKIKAEPSLFLF